MQMPRRRYGMNFRLYQLPTTLLWLWLAIMVSHPAFAANPRTIIAFGDSLMAGYQLRPGEGFAPQLEAALHAKGQAVTVINAGVSGDTTAQGRARIGWVLAGAKVKPDLVILELGANDMLRGQPPAAAKANLDAMIADFQARGIKVLLAGMLAQPNLGVAYARDFNGLFPALAKARGVPLYPFFMDGVAAVPGLQLSDGLHPTPAGVKIIVKRILPSVEKALAGPR